MKTVFRQGDKVFDINYGWGIITRIMVEPFDQNYYDDIYPIIVNYKKNELSNQFSYTLEGNIVEGRLATLSFTEYDYIKGGFSQDRNDIRSKSVPNTYDHNTKQLNLEWQKAVNSQLPKIEKQFLIKCGVIMDQGIHINKRVERYFLVTAFNFSDACEKIEKNTNDLHIQYFDNCTL